MTTKRPNQWKPGQSGNPRGRKPGTGEVQKLRAGLAEHVPEILDALVTAAKGGDVQACRLLLDRVMPAARPVELAQQIALAGNTLTGKGRSVLDAVAAGEIAPGAGAQLLAGIGTLARVAELDELVRRIDALEARHAAQ
jgi:hypothetical protein